jgi:hypothetical protein
MLVTAVIITKEANAMTSLGLDQANSKKVYVKLAEGNVSLAVAQNGVSAK